MAAVTDYLKECISDAILALVREKPLHKLTAEEIVQKAGVGRATYFRAFSSREEAVTFKFIRLWDRYADEHGIRVRDRFDLDNALPFFQYNYSIRPLLKTVYDAGLEEAIHESFARIMVPPERTEDAAAAYRETFYAHGLYGLLDGWIRRDFQETPEEMAQTMWDIIQGPLTERGTKTMVKAILWDVDGTLLDFSAAEKAAIQRLFGEFGLGECTDEMAARYSYLNDGYWKRLERGEITKREVLIGRFREFFTELGVDPDLAEPFNVKYQHALGDTVVHRDDSLTIVKALHGKVKQYVVSNGTIVAQTKKLQRSHLGEWMDGVFLSEELGAEKPSPAFFEKVFAALPDLNKEDMLIVGDSLTSDMKGGLLSGIPTCWYNPDRLPRPADMTIDYEIQDLHQVFDLL